jgi:hypothetical protein
MEWIQAHWLDVVGALWSFDQFLKVVSKLTPTKIDDNIADYLGKFLAKFFPAKQ